MASYILPSRAGKLIPAPTEFEAVATFVLQGATAGALKEIESLVYSDRTTRPGLTFSIDVLSGGLDELVGFDTSFEVIGRSDPVTRWKIDLAIQFVAYNPTVSTDIQVPATFVATVNDQPLQFLGTEAFSLAATAQFPGQVVTTFTGKALRTDGPVTVRVKAANYLLPGRAPLPLVASYLICIFSTVQVWGPAPIAVLTP